MARFLTSAENTLSLIFECVGECRYNRTAEDYDRIRAELPCLKELNHRVNDLLGCWNHARILARFVVFAPGTGPFGSRLFPRRYLGKRFGMHWFCRACGSPDAAA